MTDHPVERQHVSQALFVNAVDMSVINTSYKQSEYSVNLSQTLWDSRKPLTTASDSSSNECNKAEPNEILYAFR